MKQILSFAMFFCAFLVAAKTPIITKWQTSDGNIKVRSIGSYTYTWEKDGDATIKGSGSAGTGLTNTITFPAAGTYILKITPDASFRFVFNHNTITYQDRNELKELSQWGDSSWNANMSEGFYNCENLVITATDIPNFSGVSDMSSMFNNCSSITDIPNINHWNTGAVITMSAMFHFAKNFNSPIGNWNVSNVTDMHYFFEGASSFNQDLNKWHVKKVTTMYAMFRGATSFNGNIADWDVSSVQYMQRMFTDCKNFDKPIENWNVSNVLIMNSMFQGAEKFNQFVGNWDVSKVTQMIWLFDGAISYNQPMNNWNISAVQYTDRMFNNASSFNQDLGRWNIKASSLLNMFDNSGLDCQNYSKILFGWGSNPNIPTGRNLGSLNMTYGSAAKPYRDALIAKGWTITGDFYDDSCTGVILGINETAAKSFKIYPNPVKESFTVQSSEKVIGVEVYNVNGQLVKIFKTNSGNISALPKGIYLVKITTDKGATTQKIIKE